MKHLLIALSLCISFVFAAPNTIQITGATPFQFFLRNYAFANMASNLPVLSIGLATDLNRIVYKNAAGTVHKIMADGSGAANTPQYRVFFADNLGRAISSEYFYYSNDTLHCGSVKADTVYVKYVKINLNDTLFFGDHNENCYIANNSDFFADEFKGRSFTGNLYGTSWQLPWATLSDTTYGSGQYLIVNTTKFRHPLVFVSPFVMDTSTDDSTFVAKHDSVKIRANLAVSKKINASDLDIADSIKCNSLTIGTSTVSGNWYDTGSFTLTWHGFSDVWAEWPEVVHYQKIGRQVTFFIKPFDRTSNSNMFYASGLPEAICPLASQPSTQYIPSQPALNCINNSLMIGSQGVLITTAYPNGRYPACSLVFLKDGDELSWTTSSLKGFMSSNQSVGYNPVTITYMMDR